MSKLIDEDELIKALNKVSMEHHESHIPMVEHDFRELIHNAPNGLICCKNCHYWNKVAGSLQGRCALLQFYPTSEWYCADAKPKQTDEDYGEQMEQERSEMGVSK